MTLVLDAGALLAVERGDRAMARRLKDAFLHDDVPVTHGGVIGQAWRGGSGRQALLAKALQFVEVVPLDEALGRRAGSLLARAGTSDVIDAAVVLIAHDDDVVVTSDRGDIAALLAASGCAAGIVPA